MLVAFPVEVFTKHGPGFVSSGALGLSEQLELGMVAWLEWYQQHVSPGGEDLVAGEDGEWRRWYQEGERLRQALQDELGPEFVVRAP